jgi:EAL domain-containing protein (putative c-di-GMP-specific phosphodiesterase class I)
MRLRKARRPAGTKGPLNPDVNQPTPAEHIKARIETVLAQQLVVTAYQPIFTSDTGTIIGLDALSRFFDGQTQPAQWFADATAVGLGGQLELLALETALAGFTEVPDGLYVAVKISPSTCQDPALIAALDQSPVSGVQIVLELTHVEVTDYLPLQASLDGLRRRGIRIGVRDASCSFASLLHLQPLAPEIITLDRALIAGIEADPARRAAATAAVTFAAQIGALVIAAGIETPAELATVRSLGLPAVQGYLLGRPTTDVTQCTQRHPTRPAIDASDTDLPPPVSEQQRSSTP